MATTAVAPSPTPSPVGERTGLWSWLTTTDHKRIGKLYLFTSLFWFLVGGIEATLIRWQLHAPNQHFVSAERFNELFTMHGLTMIFLVVMPISAAFFNFLIPLQIGARDVAFPRLNAFSYWVYLFGSLFINSSWIFGAAPDGGWFGYAPLSTLAYSPGLNMDFYVLGLQVLGISSLAASVNFITTVINLRAPGMHLMRMPIFTWMSFVTQFLILLAFPVITIALVFLQFDRFFGTNFYTTSAGADPLLWQHLFWIFGHPEVYILILPTFGLLSEMIPTFSKKPLFGYPVMVYSGILIAFLGFGVWAHHMFAVGMGPIADTVFGVTTMLIAIPTGVKIFNWLGTMYGGSIRFTTAMLFSVAMVGMFTVGGLSGVMHAAVPTDLHQTDTYFIVAHFHYVLFGGSLMGILGAIYFYFPKMYGRLLSERLGKTQFWLQFIGVNLTFFPMHFSGLLGMPRRIYTYDAGQGWDTFNLLSTIGNFINLAGMLVFAYNVWRTLRAGARAGNDPWGAPTLEWSIPSPPPEYNFARIPVVTSRYPLWDLTNPAMSAGVPHDRSDSVKKEGDAPMHIETDYHSAEALGITLPSPTIMPLVASLAIIVMFAGLFFLHLNKAHLGVGICLLGTVLLFATMYNWLLTPLEPEHAPAHH